jgi:hypothetical protein
MKKIELTNENNGKKRRFNFALAEHYLRQGEAMKKRIGADLKYWKLSQKGYAFEDGSIVEKKDS